MLRPYQRQVLASILKDYRAGIRKQLIVLPCAAGKTVCVSRLPELLKMPKGEQLILMTNRDDLVGQAAATFKRNNPTLKIGIERGEDRASPELDDVIIASIQSISKRDGVDARMLRFNVDRIRTCVIDEAHFATAAQFVWALRYLRMCKGYAGCDDSKLLIGLTATPEAPRGVGLDCLFDKITHEIPVEELMTTGPEVNGQVYSYLAPIKAFRVNTHFDISMVKSRKDDFVEADLAHALDSSERNNLILDKYLEYGEGMPGAVYAINVEHAYAMAKLANERGIRAAVVEGATSRKDRDRIYAAYAAREIQLLISVEVLVYGFDMPATTVALLAKPRKSSVAFRQVIGRFLRRSPSVEAYAAGGEFAWVKPYAILIDFVDLLGKHSIMSTPTLFGLPANFDFKGADALDTAKQVKMILQQNPGLGMTARSLTELKSQVDSVDVMRPPSIRSDVKKLSRFSWLEIFDGILHLGTKGFNLEIRQNTLGQFDLYQARQGIRDLVCEASSLKDALIAGDALVPKAEHAVHRSRAKWRDEEPSAKQCISLWHKDTRVGSKFPTWRDFYDYAKQQHGLGNSNYSKGALSRTIDRLKAPQHVNA